MEILILLIPMSVVLALLAAGVFLLMTRQGQFDDLDGPAFSILIDDDDQDPAKPESPRSA